MRLVAAVAFTVAVAASLLVFPDALLWMVAFWLAVATWRAARTGTGWLPLAVSVAVLLIKRPDWSPAMTFLGAALLAAAVLIRMFAGARRHALMVMSSVWLIWLFVVWKSYESRHAGQTAELDGTRPIVCLGDSLTTGMSAKEAYPEYLQQLVDVPVVNCGRAGVTARDMLKHLPEILQERPQIVVVELGGHDFLRGYGREATRASLVRIIEDCQQAGAVVVLAEIPRGFISDPFSGLERELAREYDLELIPDSMIRLLVVRSPAIPLVGELAKPNWSDDGLHPNVAGARMLADTVNQHLSRLVENR